MIVTLIFLDEAGDTGFRFNAASSRYFVVTMVIFDDPAQAARVDEAVDGLRVKLHRTPDQEFKFSTGSNNEVKREFLRALLPFSFRYRAIVVDKATLLEERVISREEKLFERVIIQLFDSAKLKNAMLIMDRITEGKFEQKLYVRLRQHFKTKGSRPIAKFKDRDSRRDNLLQVADMICGAVYRSYAREEDEFRRLIQSKEEEVIEL